MLNALVIGCGNIGASYDLNNDQIQTHTKAFYLDPRFSLTIYDIDKAISENISRKYNCNILNDIDRKSLNKFDVVSVCTPTDSHTELLKTAIEAEVKVIICEKPVSNNLNELSNLRSIYFNGNSKIIVNYIRRFQPAFINLKKIVSKLISNERLSNISIRYQRGFVNNCSHAFDTIEFLTDSQMLLTDIKKHNVIFDHFKNDPTLSIQAKWKHTNVSITGLSNIWFSYFEFDLYFEYHKVCIKDAGQIIEVYKAEQQQQFLQPLNIQDQYTHEQCLNNYMVNVIGQSYLLLKNKKQKDNFLQSINLNQRMLNYIYY